MEFALVAVGGALTTAPTGAANTFGLLMIGGGVVLFGLQLLVGMLVAGFRDALANAPQRVVAIDPTSD